MVLLRKSQFTQTKRNHNQSNGSGMHVPECDELFVAWLHTGYCVFNHNEREIQSKIKCTD